MSTWKSILARKQQDMSWMCVGFRVLPDWLMKFLFLKSKTTDTKKKKTKVKTRCTVGVTRRVFGMFVSLHVSLRWLAKGLCKIFYLLYRRQKKKKTIQFTNLMQKTHSVLGLYGKKMLCAHFSFSNCVWSISIVASLFHNRAI